MACSEEFIGNLCTSLSPLGEVSSRKMMGDYVIYLNGKCIITACDNTAYVKKLPCIAPLMADAECAAPYPGAKEAYILDLTDLPRALKVLDTLWSALPFKAKSHRNAPLLDLTDLSRPLKVSNTIGVAGT